MQISYRTIYRRIAAVLGQQDLADFRETDPLSRWAREPRDLANRINAWPDFLSDHLQVTPAEVMAAATVGALVQVIANRYEKNGWTLIGKDDEPY
jgi:hypothetical protein